ncbi:MAG: hypothetical protein KF690_12030, partial [Bacteroidetes bacterium]|nr:hypothetical protein [Bacteroidota bacterium]
MTPDPYAVLELHSGATPRGLLLPRMSTAQRTTLGSSLGTTHAGMLVADTSNITGGLYVWDGNSWESLATGASTSEWLRAGNTIYPQNIADRVGIGTANPQFPLTIVSDNELVSAMLQYGGSNHPIWALGRMNGTEAVPLPAANTETLGELAFVSHNGSQFRAGAHISARTANNWGAANSAALAFSTASTTGGDPQTRMLIDSEGNVGIGTSNPTSLLHIQSSSGGAFRLADGTEGPGKVLTSDASGVATWTTPGTAGIENQNAILQAATFRISGSGEMGSLLTTGNGEVNGDFTVGGNNLSLSNGTSNTILFNTAGIGLPTFTVRSPGTKLVLYPSVNASNTDMAIGMESGAMWFSMPNTASNMKFYAGNTNLLTLRGTGSLHFNNTVTNRKLVLYEAANNDHEFTGLGLTTGQFRYQAPSSTSSHVFYAATGPSTSQELMRITGTGNVGIGTNAPSTVLHVNSVTPGAFRLVDGTEGAGKVLTSDASGVATWTTPGIGTVSGMNGINIQPGNVVQLGGSLNQYTQIFSNGFNFRLVRGAPSMIDFPQLLNDNGSINSGSALAFEMQRTDASVGTGARLGAVMTNNTPAGFTADIVFQTTNNAALAETMRIRGNGNVGIGTTTPYQMLSLVRNVAPATDQGVFLDIHNLNGTTGALAGIRLKTNAANTDERFNAGIFTRWNSLNGSKNHLDFAVKPNSVANISINDVRMSITEDGLVGIGTTTPQANLHINGSFQLVNGNQQSGYVLTSNAWGVGTWTDPGTLAWGLNGNAAVPGNFLGTTNTQPLEFRVNNVRTGMIYPDGASSSIVWGSTVNTVSGTTGSVISGGGSSGSPNTINANFAAIGGGMNNTVSGAYGAVNGGNTNTVNGTYGTVGGGTNNLASNTYTLVGGGGSNTASGGGATVSGGYENKASANYASVGGGYGNTASGSYSSLMGGFNNSVSGTYATVAGGNSNIAYGNYSFTGSGSGLRTRSYAETVFGLFNDTTGYTGNPTSNLANDPVFSVGIGTSNAARKNAMTILKNGNVGIGVFPSTSVQLNVQTTVANSNAIRAENTNTSTGSDEAAIHGIRTSYTGYGIGVRGTGNYRGVLGEGPVIGVYGLGNGSTGNITGVYGLGSGSTGNK